MDKQKINKSIARATGLVPFLFLLSISIFYLWVKVAEGHLPSYGNPDPKFYPFLHHLSTILMLLLPVSFLLWCGTIFTASFLSSWKTMQYTHLPGLLGFALIALLIFFDPMGILNWLAD